MSQTKVVKGKAKQSAPKLKMMHTVSTDGNGAPTITSRTVQPSGPKLKEAKGPDKQQAAAEHGHKVPKDEKAKTVQETNGNGETALKVLSALSKLGGTSESMPIAKELGFDKKYPKTPRGHVRTAMEHLSKAGFVKSKKTGVKYEFTITEAGKHSENGVE